MWDNFNPLIKDDKTFYSLVIGLVAIASFGLGRLSIDNNQDTAPGTTYAAAAESIEAEYRATSTEVVTSADTKQLYVGSKNSDKYHLPWCSGAKRIAEANKVFFNSKEEAEAAGYVPAGNCKGI